MTRSTLKTTISDEDMAHLLQRAQRYDLSALDRLYELYADRLYRYVWYRVRDADLAEDLAAEIFVQVIQSVPAFRISARDTVAIFSGWLFRIAHNYLYHFYRRREREETVTLPAERPAETMDLTRLVEDQEREEALHAAIASLPEAQHEVLILRFWERMSHAEVGKVMGRSEGAVKVLQHRALAALRRILAPCEAEASQ